MLSVMARKTLQGSSSLRMAQKNKKKSIKILP